VVGFTILAKPLLKGLTMTAFTPLRELPTATNFREGDVFILFGELFGRGYANGLIDLAKKHKMTIVGITVGRRDADKKLRPLTDEELTAAQENLGGEIINIPLEAGFDMDAPDGEQSPVEMLAAVKRDDWTDFKFDWDKVEACRQTGINRFKTNLADVAKALEEKIPSGANVFIAHTMAGGIPRTRIYLSVINRIFKGKGDRFTSSKVFSDSDLGKICSLSFMEVTANTFSYLMDATQGIRDKVKSWDGEIRYCAYGYHGTEVVLGDKQFWQTYTPYFQGDAKMKLEDHATEAWSNGTKAVVFNCPEIRTNSSDVFQGLEIPLFTFLDLLKQQESNSEIDTILKDCASKVNTDLDSLLDLIKNHYEKAEALNLTDFENWPLDNTLDIAELGLGTSAELTSLHISNKDLISDYLSKIIMEATGTIMFYGVTAPEKPVVWLGHDLILKAHLHGG
jgi:hypothetical protein